ncbi:T9SS type A sorting domain-containing protein [Fulvivirga sedimenti]|uniref:T9SS type A sorting domain-containing protein n=1 Tax=Fulvivirga sedimenti TaxID=2879465 RepID=A0A9X1HVT3_9BACT|nr:T9SS type A sorting domain-containing protein [Fulvivirga sedimenti]MCA6078786.1 T9SS type A sorting domain-containing protein [Fulvivirga sedimenti]
MLIFLTRISLSGILLLASVYTYAQCTFTIQPANPGVHCYYGGETAVWANLVNTGVSGTTISKTAGGNNSWNAGASSTSYVYAEGFAQSIVQETNRDRAFGLSSVDTDDGINSIEYAFLLRNNGDLDIYESGTNIGQFGTYSTSDVLKISIENDVVKYYQNGTLLYLSNTAPTLPLLVDISINDIGGTIADVEIHNGFDGTFAANLQNPGTGATYDWYLNGVFATTGSTYAPATLNAGDVVTANAFPGTGGCGTGPVASNSITVSTQDISFFGQFDVIGTADPYACKTAAESATFGSIVNIFVTGNDLLKGQGGNNNWDAGTTSLNTVQDNGYLEFVAGEDAYDKMIGLSNDAGDASFNSIDYAIYLQNDDDVRIYQNGSDITGAGTYTTGDVFRLGVEDGVVKYYKNGVLLYISNDAPTLPLLVDVSMNDQGAAINDVTVVNGNTGDFTVNSTNAGSNPRYQWQLNGTDLPGETASTYTNTSLVDGDIVTCVITPDLAGCTGITYTSQPVTISEIAVAEFGTFYVENTADPVACISAAESVTFENIVNVFVTGNSVLKGQGGNNSWNAGANSLNSVKNNGYMQFTAGDDAFDKMIGISNDIGNESFNSIDYAFYLQNDDDIHIYENGSDRGNVGTYTTGDIFKIAVESGEVKFYQNDVLIYISNVAPALPMVVDLSLNDAGAALNDIIVVNGNTGVFTAIASNAGSSPSYQWQVNGVDVSGETSAVFTNTSLREGDIVTCVISPDLGGCSDVTYTSQPVEILEIPQALFGDFYITNIPATDVQPVAFEELTWSTNENVFISGNTVTKRQGSNNQWDAAAFSANTVGNQAYAQTVVTQTGYDRAFGLSNAYSGSGFNTIDFKFYLVQNGQLRIYEGASFRGVFGTYSLNDTLKIGVVDGEVVYYQNSTLLYTSTLTPTLPQHVSLSINDLDGSLSDLYIVSLTEGNFTATTTNAGASPQYQWKLNGTDVGTDSPILSYPVLNDGDIFTVEIIPDIPGCANISNPYVSNRILINMYDLVLPVELLYFNTKLTEIGTELTWATSLEIDNDEFVILKSSDGESFTEVVRVKGQGNADTRSDYRYHDLSLNSGTTYYRLDQIDFNGTRRNVAMAHIIPGFMNAGYRVVNNPVVSNELKFIGDPANLNGIMIYTPEGRLMAEFSQPGENHIDVADLPSGIYLVQFIHENIITTNRVIIK